MDPTNAAEDFELEVGDHAWVADGVFRGFQVDVIRRDNLRRVARVSMKIFGQPVELEFDFALAKRLFHPLELEKCLVQETTYRDHVQKVVHHQLPEPLQQTLAQQVTDFEHKLQPGDELWEWRADSHGPLRGLAGLAIIRRGKIVEAWSE